jgi:hypothetical protein
MRLHEGADMALRRKSLDKASCEQEVPKMQEEYESEEALVLAASQEFVCRQFFTNTLMNSAFHWFFTQGQVALTQELYIPGVSALLNGIEASLRATMAQLEPGYSGKLKLSKYQLLSNTLLRKARDRSLPITTLAFPGEDDFHDRIEKNRENVRIVQLRHDICHGDILEFIQTIEQKPILTPECLRGVAAVLLGLSFEWAQALAHFRDQNGLRPPGVDIPPIPRNPLAHWLEI